MAANATHHTHCSTTAKDESQNGSNGSDHYLYFRPSLSSTWNTLMTQLVAVFHYEPMRTALASSVRAPKWYSTAAGCLVGRRMNLHRVWRSDNPESQIQTKLPRTLNLSQSSKVQAASDSLPPWGLLLIRWSNWSQDVSGLDTLGFGCVGTAQQFWTGGVGCPDTYSEFVRGCPSNGDRRTG